MLSCSAMALSKCEFLQSWLTPDGTMLTLPSCPAEDTTTSEYLGGASAIDGANDDRVLEQSYKWASSQSWWLRLWVVFWRLQNSTATQQQDAMHMIKMAKIVTIAPMIEALSPKMSSVLLSEIKRCHA